MRVIAPSFPPPGKRKTPARVPRKSRTEASNSVNIERGIFLQGELDQNLFRSLTPQILGFKETSSHPITVLITIPVLTVLTCPDWACSTDLIPDWHSATV